MKNRFDPLLIEVIKNEFASVNEEMAIAVYRTGRSLMVKIGDSATVLADSRGRFIGEGASVFQVGVFMSVMEKVLDKFSGTLRPGDVLLANDPYSGMGHMPDVAVIAPVFWRGQLVAFTLTYSHHTDIGGRFAGGFTILCTESFEEGVRIPIVKFYQAGRRDDAVADLIAANVRNPQEWLGDVDAKIAGCRRGEQELGLLLDKYGPEVYAATCDYLQDYAERATRAAIRAIPPGQYSTEDFFEDDGLGTPGVALPIRIKLRAESDALTIDLTGTAPQVKGAINVPYGMTRGGIYSAVRAIVSPDVLTNDGFVRPLRIINPEGTILNPRFPGAVGGRAPLFFRLMDSMFRVLAKAMPDRVGIPGEGGDLIHFSSRSADGRNVAFMDVFCGGWGGRPTKDGIDAVAPVSFGAAGTPPVELVEREHPVVIEAFGNLPDTEGAGKHRGSLSTFRKWRFLRPGTVMIRSNRLTRPSTGMAGGGPGALSKNVFISAGRETVLPPHTHQLVEVKPGDRILHVVSGTGGYGNPMERDPQQVLADVVEGKISIDRARDCYGVEIDSAELKVDNRRTTVLRSRVDANTAAEPTA